MSNNTGADGNADKWARILTAIRSPLSFFALTILVCNSIFVMAAASMDDIRAFTYAIHAFLAIIGTFVLIALWSPRSLYHPEDIKKYDSVFGEVRWKSALFITIVLMASGVGYVSYQIIKANKAMKNEKVVVEQLGTQGNKAIFEGTLRWPDK